MTWPAPDFVGEHMTAFERDVLRKHSPQTLKDDESFCLAVAEIQGEFLTIHPFREGNARTIKVLTNLLAAQTGRAPLAYDTSPAGADAYIAAAKSAFSPNYAPMAQIIRGALARVRSLP